MWVQLSVTICKNVILFRNINEPGLACVHDGDRRQEDGSLYTVLKFSFFYEFKVTDILSFLHLTPAHHLHLKISAQPLPLLRNFLRFPIALTHINTHSNKNAECVCSYWSTYHPVLLSLIYFLLLSGKDNGLSYSEPPAHACHRHTLSNDVRVRAITTRCVVFLQLRDIFNLSGLAISVFFSSGQFLTVFLKVGTTTFSPLLWSLNNYIFRLVLKQWFHTAVCKGISGVWKENVRSICA